MVLHADSVTNKNTTAPLSGTEQRKRAGKTPKKSWRRSLSSFFTGKSVKASPKLHEEPTLSVVPVNQQEQNVEATPEPPWQQKTQEVPPEQPARQDTLDRVAEIRDVDNKGLSGSNRTNDCMGSADGVLTHVEDSCQQELESSRQVLENETGEHRIAGPGSTPGAAAKSDSNPHERNTNNAHALFFRQDDLSTEAKLPVALFNENATGNKSHTGCPSLGKRSQNVPKGKIIYSKAGGREDDTITFEVSLNDSLMKEVLNSIEEGQIPVSLATYGRRGKSTKDYPEKCASTMGPDDTSDQFSVDIELCDPMDNGEKVEGEHTDGNNVGGCKHYSLFPEVVEFMVRRQSAENDAHEAQDRQLRNGSLPEGRSHSKEFTELLLSPITTSSNSALTSYSSHDIDIVEFDHGRNKGGPCTQSSSNIVQSNEDTERRDGDDQQITTPWGNVGMPHGTGPEHYPRDKNHRHTGRGVDETQGQDRKGPKIRKRYSSSNSSMEYQNSNLPKRYPSSNSSVECQRSHARSKGRKTDRLRDRAIVRAHMKRAQLKKQRRSEAEAIDSTFCSFKRHRQRQNSSSQGTESLSTRSERYPEEDVLRNTQKMSDDVRDTRIPRNGGEKLHVRRKHDDLCHSLKYRSGGKDEEIVCTTSDDETQSYKNRYSENSSVVMSGPKRAKRAGWSLDKGADECKPAGFNEQGMATGVRRYQSSCSTILSFSKSKASVGDCGDTFLDHIHMSEVHDSSITERVAGYGNVLDDSYSRSSLHGKQMNAPRIKTCWDNLKDDRPYSDSGPEHSNHAADCGDWRLFLEPVDQDWNASTPDEYNDEHRPQNPEDKITIEELRTEQGPENKWLQRIGNLSLAQESNEGPNGHTQREGDVFLTQEPHFSYSSRDSNKPAIISKNRSSDSRQDQSGDQQIHRPPKGSVEEHGKIFQSTKNKAPGWNGCLTEDEVGLEDESFTRNENLAANTVPKDLGMQVRTPSTPQHTANGDCMAQAFQSLLQSLPRGGCCHTKSEFCTEGSLSSPSKDRKLKKDSSSAEKDTCDLKAVVPGCSFISRDAARNDITENQATEYYQTTDNRSIYAGHSLKLGAICTHAGPRRKARCILAGAIKSGTNEIHQPGVREEPCRHEFIGNECKNEFMYSSELPRRTKDKPSIDPTEEHVRSSQHVSQVFVQEIPSTDLDDLKQREASWKQCQKRYEAMVTKIQKMSEQAHSGLDLYPDVSADTIHLGGQIQKTSTDSNISDNNSIPAYNQTQRLASCSCERSLQVRKLPRGNLKPSGRTLGHRVGRGYIFRENTVKSIVKRNVSDDSSSDEDIYDRKSRKFRDELFKRVPRKNENSLSFSSQVLTVSCGDCVDQVTRKKVHEVHRHLRDLTSSDPFRFSAVYKELLRVEQELKEIATAFASQARMEKSNSLDATENSYDSKKVREKLKSKGSEGKKRPIDRQDGGSELVGESSPDLGREFSVSVYENPMWSKWMRPKTNSCGGPLSVHMAARLSHAEVPIDYENGYKVQYVPVDKRGNTGMRDKHPGLEKRCRLLRSDKTSEPLKNSRLSADDSSSSSSCNPGGSPNMQVQALSGYQEYDSSSSDSGSKLLHKRHHKEESKDARCKERHKFETDSDSTNNSSWSDEAGANLEIFVGEAEDQLARLKLAKVQLGRVSPESLARVNTFCKKPLSKTSDTTGSDHWITERYELESEFPEGRRAEHVMRQKKRRPTVATTLPLKKLTAREIKEFHLLERRVQRELGASGKNREPANCQDQGRIFEHSNKSHDNARADEVLNRCRPSYTSHHHLSQVAVAELAGDDKDCGKTRRVSSPIEQLKDTKSSVMRLFFGGPREEPPTDEGITAANDIQGVSHLIHTKVELLETEILNFTTGNRKMKAMLKEQGEHADRLKRDKETWEQQKASDMEVFHKFKDAQMSKLQKERTKLEQQARTTVSQVSKKEERRALDELKARLAQAQEAHSKREEQWRLTSNRLRKANKELLGQIHELRNQIQRLEEQIFFS